MGPTSVFAQYQAEDFHPKALELAISGLSTHSDLLWGAAFDQKEFVERNFRDSTMFGGALGRDVRRSLPGLYWLNVFGRAYVDVIGSRALETAPASTQRFGDAIMLELYGAPGSLGF